MARRIAVDGVVLAVLTLTAAAAYVWTKAPLYNAPRSVDPWLYTAFWSNFDQVYGAFHGTYYASRLPWILPGYLVNAVFDVRTAYFVIHSVFFLGGGVLFYLLCRRWLGLLAAATGYMALIGCQMYFNAHRWDYQEGAVLTYMIAAYAFSLPRTSSPWVRASSLALGGFFAAAVVTTRIIDGAYLAGLPILYCAVVPDMAAARVRQIVRDFGAFAGGAMTLLLAGGWVARRAGGEFFFFMPQIRVVRSTTGGYNQIPVDQWLPDAPYFWVPPFVIAFSAVVLAVAPGGDRVARRVLFGSAAWLTLVFTGFALWQFLDDGWLLNLGYYFSSFLIPTLLCLAAAAAVLAADPGSSRMSLAIVVGCAAATLGPVIWIYKTDSFSRVASGYSTSAYVATIVGMGLAILLALIGRVPRFRAAGAAAIAAAFFAVAHGVDASQTTWTLGASTTSTGGLYNVGQQLIGYLRAQGYRKRLPTFWYDAAEPTGALQSIQSLYFFAYTQADIAMPHVTERFRSQMTSLAPDQLVLMCTDRTCEAGSRALRQAGYAPHLRTQTVLASDGVAVRVQLYDVTGPA